MPGASHSQSQTLNCQHVCILHVLARVYTTHASTCVYYTCQHVCILHVLARVYCTRASTCVYYMCQTTIQKHASGGVLHIKSRHSKLCKNASSLKLFVHRTFEQIFTITSLKPKPALPTKAPTITTTTCIAVTLGKDWEDLKQCRPQVTKLDFKSISNLFVHFKSFSNLCCKQRL